LTEAAKILKKLREAWHPIGEVVKAMASSIANQRDRKPP